MSIAPSTTSCDKDKLWIEEFLNMDDTDDEYYYCSSSDFGETCANNNILNTYLGDASTGACPELHHNNNNNYFDVLGGGGGKDQAVSVPQIQGGTFRTTSYSPKSHIHSNNNNNNNNNNIASKRRKVGLTTAAAAAAAEQEDLEAGTDGHEQVIRIAHITVERNRRKQMNHNLSLLRSLMPSFYVKRADQASIIGGVIDYINELQLLLQSLEAKRQRKVAYNELVLSPRLLISSPIPSPRKPPLSPRLILPISPTTPQPTSPYNNKLKPPPPHAAAAPAPGQYSPTVVELPSPSSASVASSSNVVCVNELAASSKSAMANVEVKFSGQNNLLLKTASPKIPGQALKIISALEKLALEILHVSISTIDDTMLNSFTIKIGIECQLSAEELAQQIQQTFR